jgi:hypothetical protein
MTIFAIMGTGKLPELAASIMEHYPTQFYKLRDAHWFVSDIVTSREVSDKLGMSDGVRGEGVVLAVSGYWGLTDKQLWEWLASREGISGV